MLSAVTASITHDDPYQAGRDLGAELLDGLGGQPDAVLLFSTHAHDPRRLLDGLYRVLDRGAQLVGCSAFGELDGVEAVAGSATAMALRTDGLGVRALLATDDRKDSFAVGRALGEQAREFGAALLILLIDAVHLATAPVLAGAQSVLGLDFPIVGGVAADDARFARTFELHNGAAHEGAAVALALRGPLKLATVARRDWRPIGLTHRCTRVEGGRVVLELDGQPALDLYRAYLGEWGRDLATAGAEFPLGIVTDPTRAGDDELLVVRGVQGYDEARGGLRFLGEVPEGAAVRVLRATKDDLIAGAGEATADLVRRLPGARVALLFDCAGRRLFLGARHKEEIAAAYAHLPPHLPRIGFYTFGELSPVGGRTMHHEETFTAALIEG